MRIPQNAASFLHIVGLGKDLVLQWNFLPNLKKHHADVAANLFE